jgi:hypothetical protein
MTKTIRPRTFFRGTNPGDERRISTGNGRWDGRLFCSSDLDLARAYGSSIERIEAREDARILYEGTTEFRRVAKGIRGANLLEISDAVTAAAEAAHYDAVWFRMQGNVGTAIINQAAFVRGLPLEAKKDPEDERPDPDPEEPSQSFRL